MYGNVKDLGNRNDDFSHTGHQSLNRARPAPNISIVPMINENTTGAHKIIIITTGSHSGCMEQLA